MGKVTAAHAKRVILLLSSKGGVGKSTFGRAFLDIARARKRTVSAHDLDGNTASLSLVYEANDPLRGVAQEELRADIGNWSAPTQWALAIANDTADDVLIDVPGGGLQDFTARFSAGIGALYELAKRGKREIVVVSVIGVLDDSFMPIQDVFDVFGNNVHHVVVKNGFFAENPQHFVLFDGLRAGAHEIVPVSKTRRRADELKAEIMFFPRLPAIEQQMAACNRLSYVQAADDANEDKMGDPLKVMNMRAWLESVEKNMKGSWVDPSGAGATPAATSVSEGASVA